VVWSQPVVRSQRHNVIAICLIFEAARSPCGAAAGGGSWDGSIDGEDTCGVLLKLFDGFFGAAEDGTGFFFGFRPRLLGMGKRGFELIRVGRDVSMIQEPFNSPTGSND
jgi:hypothetical protein